MSYNESIIAFFMGMLLAFVIAIGLLNHDKRKEAAMANYNECKTHTTDLEWCFRQFKPEL